jgi:hypothetical protein
MAGCGALQATPAATPTNTAVPTAAPSPTPSINFINPTVEKILVDNGFGPDPTQPNTSNQNNYVNGQILVSVDSSGAVFTNCFYKTGTDPFHSILTKIYGPTLADWVYPNLLLSISPSNPLNGLTANVSGDNSTYGYYVSVELKGNYSDSCGNYLDVVVTPATVTSTIVTGVYEGNDIQFIVSEYNNEVKVTRMNITVQGCGSFTQDDEVIVNDDGTFSLGTTGLITITGSLAGKNASGTMVACGSQSIWAATLTQANPNQKP